LAIGHLTSAVIVSELSGWPTEIVELDLTPAPSRASGYTGESTKLLTLAHLYQPVA
jgi:hypothetical protein